MNEEVNKIESSEEYKEYLKNRKSIKNKVIKNIFYTGDIEIPNNGDRNYPEIGYNKMGCTENSNNTEKARCILLNNIETFKNHIELCEDSLKLLKDTRYTVSVRTIYDEYDYGHSLNDIQISIVEPIYETFEEYKNRIYTEKQKLKKNREEKILNCKQNMELYKKQLEELEKEDET